MWPIDSPVQGRGSGFALSHSVPPNTCVFGQIRWPRRSPSAEIALPTRHNGEEYRGINVLMLWIMAAKQGHVSSRWMTYKQAQELGGQVRKGETSSTVVKYGTFTKENELGPRGLCL